MKVIAAWSGGKDSCFAYCKAVKAGLDVFSLVTFMHSESMSNFHGIRSDLLDAQAKALGIPLLRRVTTPENYETQFKDTLTQFRANGVKGIVTGDIYEVAGHEEHWLEQVCREVGYLPIRPLWQGNTTELLKEFINAGFKAIVVRTKLKLLGIEWLGRQLDNNFLYDILKMKGIDPCGEKGEYHTIVTNGPFFNQGIELTETKKTSNGEFGRLEIDSYKIRSEAELNL